ncbi:SusC/RagA family TonB-linked outer membrane protein [Neptunitalea sp. Y10]|uniref:SusC/RagA family TonB-linked outer membrane protein n=2 Tax=Neptunitalea lumnitzerae TaxID=2965509 RepID=A0ABQ5MKL6_9FLAO|nr:SusC/RagA family TonB-linked outer membrane protein [Neptunitalea sp. Y10]
MCFAQSVFSQSSGQVSGTITSTNGEPIAFANVIVKGTSIGTSADFDGNYTIDAAPDAIIVFSYIGFKTQEIPVNNRTIINVTMEDDIAALDEVIVVGYGTQKKEDLTSAIAVVKSDQIAKRQTTTVAESLQGLATGVNVRGGGRPGSEAKIEIRGLKNLQSTNPLYVIDGVITTANRDFNPNDIETIQILKDAAAAAIYGSRAANGVVIITTKKGKAGPMKIEASTKMSTTTMPRYDLVSKDEFVRLNNMAYDNAGYTRQDLNLDVNTDWQDVAFRTGFIQDHNVSFSGGGENSSYFVSANYFGNRGTVISTDFERMSFRVNTSGTKGIFTIGENVALSNSKTDEMSGNPLIDVYRLLPTIPIYDNENPGGYGYGKADVANTFAANPLAIADLSDATNQNFRIRGNVFAEIKPFSFLKYRLNLGYETSFDNYKYLRKEGNWALNQAYQRSYTNQNRAQWQNKLIENTLTFNKEFGKHSINVVAGTTYQKETYEQINGTKYNLIVNPTTGEYFEVLNSGDSPQTGGYKNEAVLISYLGRLEYNYDDRYLFNAVIRRDGSSRFSESNKWGSFPSLSLGWRINKESFFNVEAISDLKLRASYGELGSGNIGYYEYQGFINSFGAAVFGVDQEAIASATQVQLANNNLRWEVLKQTNIGFDLGLLDNRLQITSDYFIAKTEDVLFGFPILMTTGNDGGNPISNAAVIENKGFEFNVSYNQVVNDDFSFNASINFTTLNNKLVELGNGLNESIQGNTITRQGESVGMWYVLQTDGLFQNQDEINNYTNSQGQVIMPNAKPGDIRYKDINDDGQITTEDRAIVGSPWPDFEMGLNAGVNYKNFDFSMNWISSHGATVYNGFRSTVDRFDDDSNYRAGVQPWTPENPNTNFPRAEKGYGMNARGDTDRWLEDGSFARLKYIGVGYTVPKSILEKIGFSSARISISAQNIITITNYGGLDPEFNNSNIFQRGVDSGSFPNLKTYSLGLNFGF